MAKSTLKRKMRKKKMKSSSNEEGSSSAKKMEVAYDDEDDHEDLNEDNSSEEEEGEDDERRRLKLVEAISSLGGKRKKVLGERSEAAVQMSEFTAGGEQKIDLSDLIGTLDQTPSVTQKTRKQLKTLQESNRTIESPLSKQETERIQRDLSFQKTSSEVSKWKPIITQNQRAEQLVFPLNQETSGPRAVERVVTGWKARTPLEEEIFALLNANKQPVNDPVLTKEEEASMKAMSLEEAKIRRAELQKARALQSYYESKARRERKIKSKKYHKVHNKAKRKDFVKQFDEMVKSNPAAALEELNKMEVARMQERMSLKHQNSGKWAKSKAIMAKYDEGARKAMQQQLEVNKELTQKLVTALNEAEEEEEEEEGGDPEVLPDFVNEAEQGVDPSNPWMRGKLSEDPAEQEVMEMVDLTVEEEPAAEEEEEEEEVTEEEALLREFERKRKERQAKESEEIPVICLEDDDDEEEKEAGGEEEKEELEEFTNLYKEITDSQREAEAAAAADPVPEDSSSQLEETLQRIRTLEDTEDLIIQEESTAKEDPVTPSAAAEKNLPPGSQKSGKNRKRKRGIELKQVLTKDTKVIHAPLAQTVEDAEDSDGDQEQRGLIREAFAGDDVVSDFLRDKKKQEQAGKPKVVDLTLPGWGEWGGTGLKPSYKKRRKFRIKTAPPPPRKDQHLPSIIISEKRNSAIALHQVNSLPFPFETHAQFESTVRTPLGRTWNTEQTVRKVSKPRVVTQLGAIIEPMAKEELMKIKKKETTTETPKEEKKREGSRRRVGSGRRKR